MLLYAAVFVTKDRDRKDSAAVACLNDGTMGKIGGSQSSSQQNLTITDSRLAHCVRVCCQNLSDVLCLQESSLESVPQLSATTPVQTKKQTETLSTNEEANRHTMVQILQLSLLTILAAAAADRRLRSGPRLRQCRRLLQLPGRGTRSPTPAMRPLLGKLPRDGILVRVHGPEPTPPKRPSEQPTWCSPLPTPTRTNTAPGTTWSGTPICCQTKNQAEHRHQLDHFWAGLGSLATCAHTTPTLPGTRCSAWSWNVAERPPRCPVTHSPGAGRAATPGAVPQHARYNPQLGARPVGT